MNARRVAESPFDKFQSSFHFTPVMAKGTEFAISVHSEDPKKKDKSDEKDKAEGSSKSSKDGKADGKDDGEELVCFRFIF